ncbi:MULTISPECIES: VWA domain-containing protein [unclassified Streptomyces]|uniref:VWA domain-containing protein n=1 Tax=unclassified Streptomyces TaxID=2593676 RepID=UPI0006C1CB45|nr:MULTISPECIES: VWA domain-containing protein [unclassified Streptomyces]KOX23759.1 hypothetical protein ADL06_21725 [Streptomyces sp. NRRL F-6491]KOX40745.1 hypothetical protein ADL08_21210 [Streptomyces sp. NRRL F-6492]
MGIRSMLRKVFGRDREDSPATSVPPQSRETVEPAAPEATGAPETQETPEAPEEVRRAADDLVAASFDNPQVPKARSAEPVAPAETVAPAEAEVEAVPRLEPAGSDAETNTVESAEAAETLEEETPVRSAAAEAAEREAAAAVPVAEPVEVSLPEERDDETGVSAEVDAVEVSYPETPAGAEGTCAVPAAPEPGTAEAEETEETPEAPESEDAPEAEETPEAEPQAVAATEPEPAVVAEPEPAMVAEPAPAVVAAPEPEASAPEAPAPVPTPETPVITALEPEAPETPEVTEVTEAPEAFDATAPAVAAGPALSLARVKAVAPHLADAYKAAGTVLKKQGLTGARAAVYLVVDRSGSMRGYFKDGSVQRLAEQTVALAAHLDENAAVTAVFFSTDIDGTAELTPATLSPTRVEEINAGLGRLGRTHYHRAVEEVLAHHEKTDPARPALVVFQTDGAPDARTAATQALAGAADRPLHWRFVAWGEQDNKAFDYLRKLGGTPRTAAYFPGSVPAGTAHAAFYRGLLEGLEL